MKAILIDPREMDVTEIDVPLEGGNYGAIAEALQCELFTVAQYLNSEGDALFCDDEGMLHHPEHFFMFNGTPLAGRGLVLGSDEEGETTPPAAATVESVLKCVQWLTTEDFKQAHSARNKLMHSQAAAMNAALGGNVFVIVSSPEVGEIFNDKTIN